MARNKTPNTPNTRNTPPADTSPGADAAPDAAGGGGRTVDAFLDQVARMQKSAPGRGAGRGRLMFALDATASRQPMWDRAAALQGEMFMRAAALGGLDIQLAFYRGFGEFKVSRWTDNAAEIARLMSSVMCMAGHTQINKVLGHAVNEAKRGRLNAAVFIGDMCEEDVDDLGARAGELGLLGVPVFVFQEGGDPAAGFVFSQIAKLSGGAHLSFDASSAEALGRLLGAVAVYAAGGQAALESHAQNAGGDVLRLTQQMRGRRT